MKRMLHVLTYAAMLASVVSTSISVFSIVRGEGTAARVANVEVVQSHHEHRLRAMEGSEIAVDL